VSGDGLPNPLPRPEGELQRLREAWAMPSGWRRPTAVNNTYIGKLYIATALMFLLLAGALALVMRTQLAVPGNDLVTPGTYNQLFTMHGTVMMFLFAVPVVEAVAVYLLPNMLGARDLPFPRLSAYAYWAYAFGGLAFFCTIFAGLAPDGGWFMYPPLTSRGYSPGLNADFWLLGIGFIEISAIAGAVELIVGLLMTRAPGMTLSRLPIYGWAMLVVGLMIVFAFPAVIAGTALLEMERAFDWPFFDATRGGDPLLWQHLFWFFGHPEVYIIFLPAAGMVSAILPVRAKTPLVGHAAIVAALVATGCFSFALWAHHMFTAGLGSLSLSFVSAASMAVAVPTALQVFAWIATLWRGRLQFDTQGLFILGFLFTFVLGGLTGVMLAVLPFNWQAHDTYFVVAHLHYALIGGVVFPLFAALYHWLPLLNGHVLSEKLGHWVFGLTFGGFHVAFFPQHLLGLAGMPRRVYTYEENLGWDGLNMVSTIGAYAIAAGVLLLAWDVLRTVRRPDKPHGDPWQGATLEWLPSENYATRSIPQVQAREPLWHQRGLATEVEQGRHWLPGTATGLRETLVTTPRKAELSHLIVLPGPSWLPLLAALGTAGFFLLLTVKWVWTAHAFGALAIGSTLAWLWQTDRLPDAGSAVIGAGVQVPIGARLTRSHSWWATVILVIVDMTVFASMAFAHMHVGMRAETCPPPGAALPDLSRLAWAVAGFGLSAALVGAAAPALNRRPLSMMRAALCFVPAAALAAAGFWALLAAHHALLPRADAWSASLAALLGYVGLHAVLIGIVTGYLLARAGAGLLTPRQRATYDNIALLWWCAMVQGVGVAVLPHLLSESLTP
jgi:cytochrome c oxidase subunit I+III